MEIKKIYVARGIYWVEIPEADLRILCGCPADAVKHLIKRGLILPQEIMGTACETGPNAILLSDVSLQNGDFANLAEFPILQILYKQGLILPGHPNNTGRKPLLIGSAEQVESQMRYIYRGNYGLVSHEEITQSGVNSNLAIEMMRLKLKFAFGSIQPSRNFLETCIVGEGTTEIANGVSIRRLRSNVFEFSYQDETVIVDINLGLGKVYECPYQLGFRRFEPEYFAVIHSGEGDGWDSNRPCMSSIVTFQNRIYLIDAGPDIANTLAALGIGINQVDGIFHTHSHDDHFAGLTTLMRAGRRIKYFATPLVRASVSKKLAALLGVVEEHFSDFFDIHDLDFDTWNDVDGLEVMPIFSPHPVETNIFIFRTLWGDGYRSYAHFADIVSLSVLQGMVTDQQEQLGLDQQFFERIRSVYMTPVNLKKIDVGGGMIHGDAKDFSADTTARILLAHRAGDLTSEEKEIGSSATFGSVDVLVAGQSEVMRHYAFSYLETHLPGVPLHDLRMLVNHPITEFNPGSIILKEDQVPQEVILLVSGQVEKIRSSDNLFGNLSAGALIGIGTTLHNRPSRFTYRATSFAQVMQFPVGIFAEVIQRNGLLELMQRESNLRDFLETTNLFNESLPAATFRNIIDSASEKTFQTGEAISYQDLQVINIIRFGRIERLLFGEALDVLRERDFFGEEGAIFQTTNLSHLRVLEETTVIQIPGEHIKNVPILRWKLFVSYQQRVSRVLYSGDSAKSFVWRDYLSIQVAQMDIHHKRLLEIANAILNMMQETVYDHFLAQAFDTLVNYSHVHFAAEERLMELYNYPEFKTHSNNHRGLINELLAYKEQVLGENSYDKVGFMRFFDSWLMRHIMNEDRQYGTFLNDKGVY